MPAPSRSPDPLGQLAAALYARDAAALDLEVTAPRACAEHSGADALLDRLGGRMIRGGWFAPDFTSEEGPAAWEAIAREQQAPYREGSGE